MGIVIRRPTLADSLPHQVESQRKNRLAVTLRQRATWNDWVPAELVNGFSNAGAGYAPAAYYVGGTGRVYLRGRVSQGGSFAPVTMFTLAAGYRPAYRHEFATSANFADSVTRTVITVLPTGEVRLTLGDAGSGFPVNLDVVQFRNR